MEVCSTQLAPSPQEKYTVPSCHLEERETVVNLYKCKKHLGLNKAQGMHLLKVAPFERVASIDHSYNPHYHFIPVPEWSIYHYIHYHFIHYHSIPVPLHTLPLHTLPLHTGTRVVHFLIQCVPLPAKLFPHHFWHASGLTSTRGRPPSTFMSMFHSHIHTSSMDSPTPVLAA